MKVGAGDTTGQAAMLRKVIPTVRAAAHGPLWRHRVPSTVFPLRGQARTNPAGNAWLLGTTTSAWWDWDHDTLTERMPEFKDLRSFLAKYAV
jgi:hypothetical protein